MAKTGSKPMCASTHPGRDQTAKVKKAPPEVPSQSSLEKLKQLFRYAIKEPKT